MAKAYYASKISENIARTPEGFLICYNVPIGRTGKYQYLASEIGAEGNEIVDIYRQEEDVFDQRTLASFEGKAFTDTHPAEDVTTENWSRYAKGELKDVRRGKGEYSDCIVADIIVRDPITISQIESGCKREVSAGYSCDYKIKDGKYYQTHIIGNHVALVQEGRAGHRVAIKDEDTVQKKLDGIKKKFLLNSAIITIK